MREARRQNRNTRPALTKHTPIASAFERWGDGEEAVKRGKVASR
jgi:hypothetical protein